MRGCSPLAPRLRPPPQAPVSSAGTSWRGRSACGSTPSATSPQRMTAALAEEMERRRIAVGIHDQISQSLARIKMMLGGVNVVAGQEPAEREKSAASLGEARQLLSVERLELVDRGSARNHHSHSMCGVGPCV